MGAQPSKKELNRDDSEDDFVRIDSANDGKAGPNGFVNREPEGLVVHLVRDWRKKLLEDPKNRFVVLFSIVIDNSPSAALSGANPPRRADLAGRRRGDRRPAGCSAPLYPDSWNPSSSAVLNYVTSSSSSSAGTTSSSSSSSSAVRGSSEGDPRRRCTETLHLGVSSTAAARRGVERSVRKTPLEFARDKAAPRARARVGEPAMTHAMVLMGVHVNSWGAGAGDKGWFVMSDAWMDEFAYQAVVDPRFLAQEVRDVLKKEPIVLPLWGPNGEPSLDR
ncbi:peptidase C1-like family-domain-containing protein [Biscogniauxia marginata]|nr:peptidase C1-like family-domain-containing protein [Biscogniauxia marginata]